MSWCYNNLLMVYLIMQYTVTAGGLTSHFIDVHFDGGRTALNTKVDLVQ